MITADSRGTLRGDLIPTDAVIRAGARELILTSLKGTVGRATIHFRDAEGGPTIERPPDQIVQNIGVAAIAQTFTLAESRFVRQIQLNFCTVPSAVGAEVRMQIRETENGIPTAVILAEKVLTAQFIQPNGWCPFTFEPPVPLLASIEYCITLITADPGYTVAIAKQGQYVNAGDGPTPPYPGWITRQPYQIGVLQVSSNVNTWTAMQDSDLTFRIVGCVFSGSPRNVVLGDCQAVPDNVTDMMARALVHRPFGVADAQFILTNLTSGETHTDLEYAKIRLDARRTGKFRLTATLMGDTKSSALLFPNARVELGNLVDTADYITKPFDSGDEFNCTVIFDGFRSGNSAITLFVAQQRFDIGGNPIIVGGVYQWDWVPITNQVSAVPIGNGWNEETWNITTTLRGIRPDYKTRMKITLAGGPTTRPIVKNLRVITILA